MLRGGWEGHSPRACTELFTGLLRESGFRITVRETLDAYADGDLMAGVDLILQCWTDGRLSTEQEAGLLAAVGSGTGFAGWHGGVVATFSESNRYAYLVGGRFLVHPGDVVDYDVDIVADRAGHEIVTQVSRFPVHTEQYFCLVDPGNDVLATTTFAGDHGAPETAGVVMPVVWTRRYGAGRVFVSTLGHAPADLELPPVRAITGRGLLWAARPAVVAGGAAQR